MNMRIGRSGIDNEKPIDANESFDRQMRQLHATAVDRLSPQTLARLRDARQQAQTSAPRKGHAWRWATATALSAVLAVTIGLQLLPKPGSIPVQPVVATVGSDDAYADSVSTLDENPDLYVWLASSEAEPLAME